MSLLDGDSILEIPETGIDMPTLLALLNHNSLVNQRVLECTRAGTDVAVEDWTPVVTSGGVPPAWSTRVGSYWESATWGWFDFYCTGYTASGSGNIEIFTLPITPVSETRCAMVTIAGGSNLDDVSGIMKTSGRLEFWKDSNNTTPNRVTNSDIGTGTILRGFGIVRK